AEVRRVYSTEYKEKGFVPEIQDHLDPSVFEEFKEITGSCLTQSRVVGIFNEMLANDDIVVGASGSLPGDLQRIWRP
ncbi:hypothetical protein HJV15_17210, partial [[Clostridium] scindens]|nr:hypothetical protein [[Clostridium] scindens]